MFCIVEGCDGTGKSTLADQLHSEFEHLGYVQTERLHRGVPERNVLDEYQLDVEDFRPGGDRAIVADRWHWGDTVYGELYRGKSTLGTAGFRYVELFLLSRGAVTFLIENSKEEILRRLRERGEDYLKEEHVGHVLQRYREVMNDSATGVAHPISINNQDEADLAVETIIKHATFWHMQAADLAPFPTYIGGRTPRVLLVGDRRSDPDGPSMTAFRPSPTIHGSGAFLLEALPERLWRDVGICNGNEEEDLPALLDVLAGPPVVALGHEASKSLRKAGIEHASVPHPAKVQRFHNKEQVAYGQLITNIIGKDTKKFSWPR